MYVYTFKFKGRLRRALGVFEEVTAQGDGRTEYEAWGNVCKTYEPLFSYECTGREDKEV